MTANLLARACRALLPLVLCAAAAAGAQPILVGQVGPFTVLPSPDAKEVNQGARAAFARVNRAGGVQGRRIEIFELDDRFSGEGFAEQLAAAAERRPVALITPIGSAALSKLVNDKLLDRYPLVIVNAIPGAEPFRNPGHPRLFHIRASDRQQIEKIVQHARTLGMTRLGVLHQDLPIGLAGLQVVQTLGQQAPALVVPAAGSKHEPEPLAAAAVRLVAERPQATVVIGTPRFMADAVAALRKAGARQFVFALSYLPPGLVVKVAGDEGARGVAIAQAFPNPNGVSLRLQREFREAMREAYPDVQAYSSFQLEGYVSARVLVEGLRRVSGEPNAENLAAALRGLGPLDLGGFLVSFGRSNEGSRFVDIGVVGEGGKLMY